jgi:hypothetical protein
MASFLRAIERRDHTWLCRWGDRAYGEEPDELAALTRLRDIARVMA